MANCQTFYIMALPRTQQQDLGRQITVIANSSVVQSSCGAAVKERQIEQSIAQIVDAIADGMYHPSMKEKMAALEARKTAIRDELSELGEEEPLRLHPSLSSIYRRKVAALTEALNKDETSRNEAVEVLRGLISTIRLTPDGEGELQVELVGELGAIMLLADADSKKPRRGSNGAYSITLVAGAGFHLNLRRSCIPDTVRELLTGEERIGLFRSVA